MLEEDVQTSEEKTDFVRRLTDRAPLVWFLPDNLEDRTEQERVRTRFLVLFSYGTIALGSPFAVVYGLLGMPLAAAIVVLACVGLVPVPLLLRWESSLDVAANWSIAALYGALVTLALLTGGIPGASAHWLILVPIFALGSCRRRDAAIWTGLTFAGYAGIFGLEHWGGGLPHSLTEAELATLTALGLVALTSLATLMFGLQKSLLRGLRRREQHLEYQARHDPLTGLPNRIEIRERLETALGDANLQESGLLLAYLDVDRFKVVNESLGHAAGNDLLRAIADRLSEVFGEGCTVARVAGDEFMLLQTERAFDEAERVGERLQQAFEPSFSVGDAEIDVSASIGIATPETERTDEQSPDDMADAMARAADRAMYEAKNRRETSWEVYDTSVWGAASRELERERRLREAIDNDEFLAHFQPIWNIERESILGFEVLARWEDPERGLVSPGEFIPLMERLDLMDALGSALLRDCFGRVEQLGRLATAHRPFRVFVNLSPKQIGSPERIERLLDVVRDEAPSNVAVQFEITETELLENSAGVAALRDAGYNVLIDDFGTGYSSLSRLRDIEVDGLKLDMEFLKGIPQAETNAALVRTIVELARGLQIPVIAEGVEQEAQLDFLRRVDCRAAQGFFLGRPGPLDQFGGIHETSSPERAPQS